MKQKLLSATAIVACALLLTQKAEAQWSVTGNSATDTAINFIGTTDAKGLKIKTGNTTRMYIDKGGRIGIGTLAPQTALDLYSATTSTAFGIRSDGGSAFIFMDKQNVTDNSTVSYRTDGTAIWQTGTFANNDFAIKNLVLGSAITCLQSNNNVGIGTTAPGARLHVAGSIIIEDGTQGVNKVLTSDANGLASWQTPSAGAETDPEVSSAITNLVAKWNGTTLVDGIIYDSGTNVGIGTTLPAAKLDVKTTSSYVAQFNGAAPMYMGIFENDVYRGYWGSYSGAAEDVDFGTGSGTTGKLHLTIQATPRLTIDNAGNVGIGTTSPNKRLHVNGGDLFVESSSGLIRFGYNGGNEWQLATTGAGADLRWYTTTNGGSTITPVHYFSQNGNVGLGGFSGPQTPVARLEVIGIGTSSGTNTFILRKSNNDTIMRVRDDGRIGIGYNGSSYGRTLNLQGTGINFYASQDGFGGAIFPTDTSLVIWSNSGSNNNLILQPSWGKVGIATYSPTAKLSVNGTANNTSGAWGVFSDSRVKTVNADFTDGLSIIKQIHPVKFTYNADAPFKADGEQIGIIAQELEKIAPYMVSKIEFGDLKDLREVSNQAYVFLLINAVKELSSTVDQKDNTINSLQSTVSNLQNQLNEMQQCVESLCNTQLQNAETKAAPAVAQHMLFQNQPNPFNQSTVIRYELSNNLNGSQIIIRDLNGNLVKSIAISNSGKGHVTINANELAAGTYTYTLVVGGESVDTKLMVVTK